MEIRSDFAYYLLEEGGTAGDFVSTLLSIGEKALGKKKPDLKDKMEASLVEDFALLEQLKGAGGEFLLKNLSTNITSLIYLLAEQQLMIGKLLASLMESGALQPHQLDAITRSTTIEDDVSTSYTNLYQKYFKYFTALYYLSKSKDGGNNDGEE